MNLQKLYEDQRQWADAAGVREKIAALDEDKPQANNQILGFLRNEVGETLIRAGDDAACGPGLCSRARYRCANRAGVSHLGDMRERMGQLAGAVEAWEKLVQTLPDRAYLALDRLERAYHRAGSPQRFGDLCARLIDQNPQDWRTRLRCHAIWLPTAGTARRSSCSTRCRTIRTAWRSTTKSGRPCSPSISTRRWCGSIELTRSAVFYLDPHVCLHCRYRSTELLWQCPQCHEWNTFVEERHVAGQRFGGGGSRG